MPLHHIPNAYDEAQDHGTGRWVLFEDFFGGGVIHMPLPSVPHPLYWVNSLVGSHIFPERFQVTKFMLLEVVAALIVALAYIWLARRLRDGRLPEGHGTNLLESLLVFVRDDIVRPILGENGSDVYLPYFWTLFLFILVCNLLGMFPMLGSPTASIWTTAGLALCSFVMFHAVPIRKIGFLPYLQTMWVPVDVPVLGLIISLLLFVIEMAGTAIKATVLAIRLFANIFAGHVVLASILTFAYAANILSVSGIGISALTVLGAVTLSLLELLVAFLQAYIFTFLTVLFVGIPLQHHADHEAEHGHGHAHGHVPTGHH